MDENLTPDQAVVFLRVCSPLLSRSQFSLGYMCAEDPDFYRSRRRGEKLVQQLQAKGLILAKVSQVDKPWPREVTGYLPTRPPAPEEADRLAIVARTSPLWREYGDRCNLRRVLTGDASLGDVL